MRNVLGTSPPCSLPANTGNASDKCDGSSPPVKRNDSCQCTDSSNRKLYGSWIDQDDDCQNTRNEVLIAERTVPVTLDAKGCRVISGRWQDPYTGRVFTDPRRLDIDHFIPLAEVQPQRRPRLDAGAKAAIRQRSLPTPTRSMSRSSRHRGQRKSPSARFRYAQRRQPPSATSAARRRLNDRALRSRHLAHDFASSPLALTVTGRLHRL